MKLVTLLHCLGVAKHIKTISFIFCTVKLVTAAIGLVTISNKFPRCQVHSFFSGAMEFFVESGALVLGSSADKLTLATPLIK